MSKPDHRSKVTLEDLLRLKRAERPTADFWADFDHELRQKQLSALLEKRPWWQGLPSLLTRRTYLPIGATAVLTLSLVSVKYYAPMQLAQRDAPAPGAVHEFVHPALTVAASANLSTVSSPLVNREDRPVARVDDRTPVVVPLRAVVPDRLTSAAVPGEVVSGESPSARSIAANLAHLEQSEPELVSSVLSGRLSPPTRAQANSSGALVELASLSTGSSKRNRLLAHYNEHQPSPEPVAPDLVRERLSRRLGDAEFIERFNRIGVKGDQFSLGLTLRL